MAQPYSGKGLCIKSTLLSTTYSTVVLDCKGEQYLLTHEFRRKNLKQKIIKFDPMNFYGSSAKFNPLLEIRKNTEHETKDILDILQCFFYSDDNNSLADASIEFLIAFITYLLHTENNISFKKIIFLLHTKDFLNVLEKMSNFHNGLTQQVSFKLLNKGAIEVQKIVDNCIEKLGIFNNSSIATNTEKSDFAIKDIMNSKKALSLYLIYSPSQTKVISPILKLIIKLIIKLNTSDIFINYKNRLLIILDDFLVLGYFEGLEMALPFINGFGIKILATAQSLYTLSKIYGKDNCILFNFSNKVFFTSFLIHKRERFNSLKNK